MASTGIPALLRRSRDDLAQHTLGEVRQVDDGVWLDDRAAAEIAARCGDPSATCNHGDEIDQLAYDAERAIADLRSAARSLRSTANVSAEALLIAKQAIA